jgi:hypothetical protein
VPELPQPLYTSPNIVLRRFFIDGVENRNVIGYLVIVAGQLNP